MQEPDAYYKAVGILLSSPVTIVLDTSSQVYGFRIAVDAIEFLKQGQSFYFVYYLGTRITVHIGWVKYFNNHLLLNKK